MLKPTLILIRGPPGSGKSTIAKAVGEEWKLPNVVVNLDAFNFGLVFNHDVKRRDEFVEPAVTGMLKKGINSVVEGVLGGPDAAKKVAFYRNIAKKVKCQFLLVNLHAPLRVSERRCKTRKNHLIGKPMPKNELNKWHSWFYKVTVAGLDIDTTRVSVKNAVTSILTSIPLKTTR